MKTHASGHFGPGPPGELVIAPRARRAPAAARWRPSNGSSPPGGCSGGASAMESRPRLSSSTAAWGRLHRGGRALGPGVRAVALPLRLPRFCDLLGPLAHLRERPSQRSCRQDPWTHAPRREPQRIVAPLGADRCGAEATQTKQRNNAVTGGWGRGLEGAPLPAAERRSDRRATSSCRRTGCRKARACTRSGSGAAGTA